MLTHLALSSIPFLFGLIISLILWHWRLSKRINRAEWDWDRFKKSPAAEDICKEMSKRSSWDGGTSH